MRVSATTFFIMFAAAASVLAQGNHDVDELIAREFDFEEFDARSIEHEYYARQSEDITNLKREVTRLERRGRAECYSACDTSYAKGPNRDKCYRKCKSLWP